MIWVFLAYGVNDAGPPPPINSLVKVLYGLVRLVQQHHLEEARKGGGKSKEV